ncbi:bifunctional ornithine acetyltransferase/N-acetylglutamate synthase [Cytobacillus kochii]|uniref:Arginine biosynthesis bifunctional protein ArgJ n=1 Tax=Cytobacillus kochii TaxID=859143 RepID=A0A248TDN3_9BACI|nr:bifunctional ornithine acetyltransferase/N-acetylglutamate synthase [Cytobacillus kochii]ASV66252.1 bifunctional ornithine acetyltransferase/N-acetylglutamate synthase [Cytobacillus kochii]
MEATKNSLITYIQDGSITTPKGFKADGIYAGLSKGKKDLGMIVSEQPASSAGVYTTSSFKAAPLLVTQESIAAKGKLQAIVVNSACANACTGKQGLEDAYKMRKLTAEQFNLTEHLVGVASTGVIGEFLDMEKIDQGIKSIQPQATKEHANSFATAILTTDLIDKQTCYSAEIAGGTIHVAGAAKGSGMIHPNMATMLGFVTTDAQVSPSDLQMALKEITNETFNQITVDGDTSTNDMVLVMANGMSETGILSPAHKDWPIFIALLKQTCEELAKSIARDGEGATKLVEVIVKGAITNEEAQKAAKQIVGSNLVKTAIHGADANWGRIIGALGQSQVQVDPNNVDISIGPIQMLKESTPVSFSEEEAKAYLLGEMVEIHVDLHIGECLAKAWGCDLSYDYVKINASYRS